MRRTIDEIYLGELRAWILRNMHALNLNAHQLSKRINVSAMTVSRLIDEEKSIMPTIPTIYALEQCFSQRAPQYGGDLNVEFRDDAIPIPEDQLGHIALDKSVSLWRMKSTALEGLGVRSNDYLVVALDAQPRHQDIVLAEVKDWDRPESHVIFRQFLAKPQPMLVAVTGRDSVPFDGFYVDRGTKIAGVAVGLWRVLSQ